MRNKLGLLSMIFAGLVFINAPLLACGDAACGDAACGAAGSSKHVGNIVQIDKEEGTFTIEDTQTYTAITFSASAKILEKAEQAQGQVMVMSNKDGAGITATSVN